MSEKKHHRNMILKIRNVNAIVQREYEPGRHDKSYKAVWRKYVFPVYPMCYRTFLNYINTPIPHEEEKRDYRQYSLFD